MRQIIFSLIVFFLVMIGYLIVIQRLAEAAPVFYPLVIRDAVVTAYNPVEGQTDSEPEIMANGERVYEGAIACPEWLNFGDKVEVLLTGYVYTCADRLNKRYRQDARFDILMFEKTQAKEWGKQTVDLKVIPNLVY